MIAGTIILLLLALIALIFTVLLLVSAWKGVREELIPTFRTTPPQARGIGLTLVAMILPALLIALLTGYLAFWLVGLTMGQR
jgi:hypothetical protein